MTHYTFNFNNQGWSTTDFQWYGSDGSPGLGCMLANGGGSVPFDYVESSITGLSIPVDENDLLSFRAKIVGEPVSNSWSVALVLTGATGVCFKNAADIAFSGGTADWFEVTGTVTVAGTITAVDMRIGNPVIDDEIIEAYFDSVYIDESPPTGPTEQRYLGIGMDNTYLYITSIDDQTLSLKYYATTDLTAGVGTFTFGTADYGDPDTFTRAIYPAVVGDLQLYLYGRDGSAIQVQYNDINGTAGWVDVGPGTATWGTAKYCVALMPQPIAPRNLIAAFSDDDIYHTVLGIDGGWTKTGDAGTALRTAGRVTTTFHQILVAGQGTAEMYYSQNFGESFTNALSGLAGTVNAIEVSR